VRRLNSPLIWLDRLWLILRSPGTLALLLVILVGVIALAQLVPQLPAGLDGPEAEQRWLLALPAPQRALVERTSPAILNRIFFSPWFWLPVAAIMLSILLATVDYLPAVWPRLHPGQTSPPPAPFLTQTVTCVGRIHREPDAYLADLQVAFEALGFVCTVPVAEDNRSLVALRGRWSWLAPLAVYGGLGLALTGFAIGLWWIPAQTVTLQAVTNRTVDVGGQSLVLNTLNVRRDVGGTVVGGSARLAASNDDHVLALEWPLYQPVRWRGRWIWLTDVQPVVKVSVVDASGQALSLIPAQGDAVPGPILALPLAADSRSVLFSGPRGRWAMQVTYHGPVVVPAQRFTVQMLRLGNDEPDPPVPVMTDGTFGTGGVFGHVTLEYRLRIFVSRGWDLLLFLIGGSLLLSGGLAVVLRTPELVTVNLNVRGSGGQATARGETLGDSAHLAADLTRLLADPEQAEDGV
jgi:hypothetical protein